MILGFSTLHSISAGTTASGNGGWYMGAGLVIVTTSTGLTSGTAGLLSNRPPSMEQPLIQNRLIGSRRFIELPRVCQRDKLRTDLLGPTVDNSFDQSGLGNRKVIQVMPGKGVP